MSVVRKADRELKQSKYAGVRSRMLLDPESKAGAVTMGEIVMESGSSLPLHRHLVEEAFFIIEGSGIAVIGDQEHPVSAGDAVLAPASVFHAFRNDSAAALRMNFFYPAVNPFTELA